MKWWPPWRRGGRDSNGVAAAKDHAERLLEEAHDRADRTDETVRRADELAARSEMFIRSVERSLHLRRGPV